MQKRVITIVIILVIAAAVYYLNSLHTEMPSSPVGNSDISPTNLSQKDEASKYETAKEISTPNGFINTPLDSEGKPSPITIGQFIGKKVILVDFWTYSCINCQRTTPYLNAWWDKYKDEGLVIIGIHTPEFEFEKNYDNVNAAVEKMGIKYPVVLDNDFSTWNAYHNKYWPRKYLIDINGYIVYDHIGEGGYAETEQKIQELLQERMTALGEHGQIAGGIAAPQAESVDATKPLSPETYFGAMRNQYLANGTPGTTGTLQFEPPKTPTANQLYLGGLWDIQSEYAQSVEAKTKIVYRYQGKNVFLVAGSDAPVRVRILRDGQPLDSSLYGSDVNPDGTVTIQAERLYRLVQDPSYGEHTLELEIENAGFRAFTFTFG